MTASRLARWESRKSPNAALQPLEICLISLRGCALPWTTCGPSDDEIKQAFSTLAGAWDQVAESVSTVLTDPEIRHQIKEAASSFATALGATITELGSELKRATTSAASRVDEEE